MTEITDTNDVAACAENGCAAYSYRSNADVPAFQDDHALIVYDGKCRLCSGVVRFVSRHDRHDAFRFAAAQSPLGAALYRHYGRNPTDYDTYIVLEQGRAYFKSDAALRLGARLGFPWSLLVVGCALPRNIRDGLYDFIARHRLRWFGTRSSCDLPDLRQAHKFLG